MPTLSAFASSSTTSLRATQRGGTILGLVLGVLIGLIAALVVAVYVTKVPIPFSPRSNTVEGSVKEEMEKNKGWDPNAPLAGRGAASSASVVVPEHLPEADSATAAGQADPTSTKPTPQATAKPTAKPSAKPSPQATATPEPASDDPLADLVKRKTVMQQGDVSSDEVAAKAEPFIYYVQIGAFINREQADSQKAQAAMAGFSADISERDQAGRLVYRVRLGPFDSKDAADTAKSRLGSAGISGALVRVQR